MTETTYIEEANIHQCNNCGAYAIEIENIKHHSSCKKGTAEYWINHYKEANKWKEK